MAGVVSQVGKGVTDFKVGDRVLGVMTGWGSFATKMVCDTWRLTKIPDSMDYATASSFLLAYGTSMHAFRQRAQLKAGETVLVLGAAGGVGLTAVCLAKQMGAKVIAAASTAEKLEVCKNYGADFLINYNEENLRDKITEYTGGNGVDVVYDPVGHTYAEKAIRSLAWKGRYLVIGFAGGDIPKIPLNLALLKGASIVGVFYGQFAAMEPEVNQENNKLLFEWYEKKEYVKSLVTKSYKLDQWQTALNDMTARKVIGKAVITMDSDTDQASKL